MDFVACAHCSQPVTDKQPSVFYDGGRFHIACAAASESGQMPPSTDTGGYGLFGFTSPTAPPTNFAESARRHNPVQQATIAAGLFASGAFG